MSFTQKFLICSTLEHAAILDGIALQYVLGDRPDGANEWSGVYVQVQPGNAPDVYGVEWEHPLTGLLGDIVDPDTGAVLLPVVTEITTLEADGTRVSDWQRLPAPEPESLL